jgi:hypothetical protein
MSDTIPGSPPDPAADPASLTRLWTEFGALWDITRTPDGYMARRRPLPAPPVVVLAAETAPALRDMLCHGYDTRELAALMEGAGAGWDVRHLEHGSAWIAISRDDPACLITAPSLDMLRHELSQARSRRRPPAAPAADPRS